MASEDGRLDILVNAAGGALVGGLMDLDDERWQTDIDKLLGYLRMMRAASQKYLETLFARWVSSSASVCLIGGAC